MLLSQLSKIISVNTVVNTVCRQFSISSTCYDIKWRLNNGYPKYWTERGVLTDKPDFSYADGRPTPYTNGQRARMLQNLQISEKIVTLMNGVEYCKNRYANKLKEKEKEKQAKLELKLKPKGRRMLKKA